MKVPDHWSKVFIKRNKPKTFFELKERSDLIKLLKNFVVNIFRRQFFLTTLNTPDVI